jgi:transposase
MMSESKSKPKRKRRSGPKTPDGSAQARRTSAVILEVLAGVMGPGEAAEMLGVSGATYYKVEARALEGLVQACETRPRRGRARTAQSELSQLQQEHAKLERECTRQQSLVRLLQRAAGVKAKRSGKGAQKGAAGKAKRKPSVRALRLAKELRDNTRQGEAVRGDAAGAAGEPPQE